MSESLSSEVMVKDCNLHLHWTLSLTKCGGTHSLRRPWTLKSVLSLKTNSSKNHSKHCDIPSHINEDNTTTTILSGVLGWLSESLMVPDTELVTQYKLRARWSLFPSLPTLHPSSSSQQCSKEAERERLSSSQNRGNCGIVIWWQQSQNPGFPSTLLVNPKC